MAMLDGMMSCLDYRYCLDRRQLHDELKSS